MMTARDEVLECDDSDDKRGPIEDDGNRVNYWEIIIIKAESFVRC